MAQKIITILCFIPILFFGQYKKLELGISIGNNGQLDKILNDFYFYGHETAFLDDTYQDKTTNLKYGVSARYFFTDKISARLKFEHALRRDYYTKKDLMEYSDYTIKQDVFNIHPSICFSKTVNKIEIMTGIEIPLFFVRDFHLTENHEQMPDSITITSNSKTNITQTGGFIWGINSFIGVKYYFLKWLGIGTEINYGFLFANIGDKLTQSSESTIPFSASSSWEINKRYRKKYFSSPEVSLSLFFAFGNGKINSCPILQK